MLRISKLTDYATVVLSYLALYPDKIASASGIAKATHLTVPTVSKILKILLEASLVKSFRGIGGGYQIARLAKEITLADVISAIEGTPGITECCTMNTCALDSLCTIKENWQVINKIIFTTLAKINLSEIIQPLPHHSSALRGIPVKVF